MSASWDELLDEMEQRLVAAARTVGGVAGPVEPFTLPPDLGPLPERLRERAAAVLDATRVMEDLLALDIGEVALRIEALAPPRSGVHRPPPTYVDSVA